MFLFGTIVERASTELTDTMNVSSGVLFLRNKNYVIHSPNDEPIRKNNNCSLVLELIHICNWIYSKGFAIIFQKSVTPDSWFPLFYWFIIVLVRAAKRILQQTSFFSLFCCLFRS